MSAERVMNPTLETITLIRHGRSTANVDPKVYLEIPDHAIPLVDPVGDVACVTAAAHLRALSLDPRGVCCWCSPYTRCRQTRDLVLGATFGEAMSAVLHRESFLLREQEFGDWDCLTDDEVAARDPERWRRYRQLTDTFGRFYFRYPNGESRADVVQRIMLLLGKLHRSSHPHHVMVLHGVTQRAFRMAWFNRPVSWFEAEPNPANASVCVIRRDAAGRWCEAVAT